MSAIKALDDLRGWLRDGKQGAAIVHSGGNAAVNDVRAFVNDKADAIARNRRAVRRRDTRADGRGA